MRVGAAVDFTGPVVLEQRFGEWTFQPTTQVTDEGRSTATFENTRTTAPGDVGGDVRLATFNVLNYFPTTGEEYAAANGVTCSYYRDRDGNPITVNRCPGQGPRGAADQASLERQQAKIVSAIDHLGASIVSLEEIENSVTLGKDRDFAVSTLVAALNADAGAGTWAYAPSPAAADLPATVDQDVIRTAFIYRPDQVDLVGGSQVLIGSPAFANAREPLAQGFKAAGAPDSDAFAVIVNHLKSKGDSDPKQSGNDNTDVGDGQGAFNGDRVRQAEALSDFASTVAAGLGTEAVFLTGDFNSYTQEDPLQVLYADGYDNLESTVDPGESTYSFDDASGSLDHVLASPAAEALVTGVDVWSINSGESVAFEYSRFNYNATDFYAPDPYRASDHDPEVVGLDLPEVASPAAASRVTARVTPHKVVAEKTKVRFHVGPKALQGVQVHIRDKYHQHRWHVVHGYGLRRSVLRLAQMVEALQSHSPCIRQATS